MSDSSVLARSQSAAVLRAADLDRAERFYTEALGLAVTTEGGAGRELRMAAGNGTLICLYLRPEMPAPHNTVACFEVDDISSAVAELRGRGVVFEEYDMPDHGLKTVDGIATIDGDRRAWFKDSEENILVIRQR